MAYVYVPDPPQQQPGYQHQPIIFAPPQQPAGKKAKKASLKQLWRAKQEIEDIIRLAEEAKKKDKKDEKPKKKDGLNWIELSLCLIFVSLPVAAVEIMCSIALVKVTGLTQLIK